MCSHPGLNANATAAIPNLPACAGCCFCLSHASISFRRPAAILSREPKRPCMMFSGYPRCQLYHGAPWLVPRRSSADGGRLHVLAFLDRKPGRNLSAIDVMNVLDRYNIFMPAGDMEIRVSSIALGLQLHRHTRTLPKSGRDIPIRTDKYGQQNDFFPPGTCQEGSSELTRGPSFQSEPKVEDAEA